MICKFPMTLDLARASATDAGNRSMRRHQRVKWNVEDYNAAVRELNRLWPPSSHSSPDAHGATSTSKP